MTSLIDDCAPVRNSKERTTCHHDRGVWIDRVLTENLSPKARLIAFILARYFYKDGQNAFPSLRTIGELAGIRQRSTIIKAIEELVDRGLVVRDRRERKGMPRVYSIAQEGDLNATLAKASASVKEALR